MYIFYRKFSWPPQSPLLSRVEGIFLFPSYSVYFMGEEMQMLTRRLTCHLRAKDALQNALHTYLTVVHLLGHAFFRPSPSASLPPSTSIGHMYKIYICLPYHVCHLSFGPMFCSWVPFPLPLSSRFRLLWNEDNCVRIYPEIYYNFMHSMTRMRQQKITTSCFCKIWE